MDVHIDIYTCIHIHTFILVYIYIHLYTYIYEYTHTYIYIYMNTYVLIYIYICMYTLMYIHSYTHSLICIHIHQLISSYAVFWQRAEIFIMCTDPCSNKNSSLNFRHYSFCLYGSIVSSLCEL